MTARRGIQPAKTLLDVLCASPLLSDYEREEIEPAQIALSAIATRSHTLTEWAGACRDFIEGKFHTPEIDAKADEEKRQRKAEEYRAYIVSDEFAAFGLELCKEQIRRYPKAEKTAEHYRYLYNHVAQVALRTIRKAYAPPLSDYDPIRANKIGAWR